MKKKGMLLGGALSGGSVLNFCNMLYIGNPLEFIVNVPWIPEPSTVNNKLKRREGSGSTGRFFD